MVDLVPSNRRAASFGLLRVAQNAGVALGPVLAGVMLAVQRLPDGTLKPNAYLPLFVGDAVTSLIFAWIIARRLRETRSQVAAETVPVDPIGDQAANRPQPSNGGSGYGRVFGDSAFMIFVVLYAVMGLVYAQMNTTFGVYIHRTFNIPQEHYTLMLASNALMVVLFQFQIARWVDERDRSRMLALGAALYAIGFGLIGFVATGVLFEAAVIVLTIGEMVIVPASQTIAADLAPSDMRGRYQAVYGLVGSLGFGIGPVIAGSLFDVGLGRWIWIGSLILGLIVAMGFRSFGPRLRAREALIEV